MPQIQKVIVFGDSLSDIGIKWAHGMGWVADNLLGKITVNKSGRFSDCRNWTDFMYEEAAGKSLVTGDARQTIAASKIHQKLNAASLVTFAQPSRPVLPSGRRGAVSSTETPPQSFYYANYAEGGATGAIPANTQGKIGLNQFKHQVEQFRGEYQTLNMPGPTLFLVWFGANDLYTAKCKPTNMSDVAWKVAVKRRQELVGIVGRDNAHFIFMNLGRPEASPRFQEKEFHAEELRAGLKKLSGIKGTIIENFGTNKYKGSKRSQAAQDLEESVRLLRMGVDLYNQYLVLCTAGNGDGLVDVASVINPFVVGSVLDELGLIEGAQPEQPTKWTGFAKKQWVDVNTYGSSGSKNVTCSDKAHPTDRVYELIWKQIRFTILNKGYKFGKLGA